MGRLTIKSKLLVLFTLVGLAAIALTGWLGYGIGKQSLTSAIFNQLTSVRASKAYQIERYFQGLLSQVETLAHSTMISQAMAEFDTAFSDIGRENADSIKLGQWTRALKRYYDDIYLARLRSNNPDFTSIEPYFPSAPASIELQHAYIAANEHPVGKKDELIRAQGPAAYHEVHSRYHALTREFVSRFGYYDH